MLKIPELVSFLFFFIWVVKIASVNLGILDLSDLFVVLAIFGAMGLFLYLSRFLSRDREKFGIFFPLFIMTFFVYGGIFEALCRSLPETLTPVHVHAFLLAGTTGFLAVAWLLLHRTRINLKPVIQILNVIFLLLAVQVSLESFHAVRQYTQRRLPSSPEAPSLATIASPAATLPDIFYIVFDGHGREDVIKELYDLDTASFTSFLREKGFFVAEKSTANYAHTFLSILSTLEGDYVDEELIRHFSMGSYIRRVTANPTMASFARHGYHVVTFKSGFFSTNFTPNGDLRSNQFVHFQEFSSYILGRTMLAGAMAVIPTGILYSIPPWLREIVSPFAGHRDRVHYVFDEFPNIPVDGPPHFAFAHVISPHPPFVFDEQGNTVEPPYCFDYIDAPLIRTDATLEQYRKGYTRQLRYIQDRIKKLIETLIARKATRPLVIVLASDHGPGCYFLPGNLESSHLKERFSNLMALYFFDQKYEDLSPDMTPVNMFRVIRSRFLGENLPKVDDRNFFIAGENAFGPFFPETVQIVDITEKLRSGH
jgi:hypothetical protein